MRARALLAAVGLALGACSEGSPPEPSPAAQSSYFDQTGRDDVLSGGVKLVPIQTPKGTFRVWTKRVGNNPRIKLLLLHGGPGATHEYLEAFDSFLPGAGIEYYYYDQLGSAYSDQPDEPELWEISRFVDEVEQVRRALGLGPENFYLYGHSWGGALALEYALAHPQALKALIVSNMMASGREYNAYAENVLMPAMDPEALKEIQALEAAGELENPRYMGLLMEHFYVDHILRMPASDWPEPVNRSFAHLNPKVYALINGPSELGLSGTLRDWDRTKDLPRIPVPALVIGARYDTMDPEALRRMAEAMPKGRYLYCANGSHMALYDDQEAYMRGLIAFLRDVDAGAY